MPITGRAGLLALHFDPKLETKNTNTAQVRDHDNLTLIHSVSFQF